VVSGTRVAVEKDPLALVCPASHAGVMLMDGNFVNVSGDLEVETAVVSVEHDELKIAAEP